MATDHDATETYRLIITRRDATEILLLPNGTEWTLPRVEIHRQQRIAEQLTAETQKGWGLETCCLFVPSSRTPGRKGAAMRAVMESVMHNGKAPAGTYWMPRTVATGRGVAEEAGAISDSLAELDAYTRGEKLGPFAKPGWLRELFAWVQEQVSPLDLRITGEFRQLNASPTFSLIRLESDDGALWFKATGEPNAHELPLSLLLARLFPKHVPQILGVHPSWNGWLSAEASGTPLDEVSEFTGWERVAEELAELQIASIGKTTELLEGKCKDLRLPELARRIDPFLARMAEFMAAQEKRSPAPLAASELSSLREGLTDACELLGSLGFPDTLGHIDCNPGNIVVSSEHCVFLDWAEGCVGNPLVTFEYLREHFRRSAIQEPSAVARLAAAYARSWTSFCSPDDLRRALAVSPLVAAFVYAISSDAWRRPDSIHDQGLAGYFRGLTRRMFREAIRAAEGSELCLD
jgi:Phosphotransferase enzyme family